MPPAVWFDAATEQPAFRRNPNLLFLMPYTNPPVEALRSGAGEDRGRVRKASAEEGSNPPIPQERASLL